MCEVLGGFVSLFDMCMCKTSVSKHDDLVTYYWVI